MAAPPFCNLPRLLAITDRRQMQPTFEGALEGALLAGVKLVQLREKELSPAAFLQMAAAAGALCARYGAGLLLNSTNLAFRCDCALEGVVGYHHPFAALASYQPEHREARHGLLGVSVHTVCEAEAAAQAGADYLLFGPVFATASHPGTPAAGLEALHEVVKVGLPVFAVGGVDAERTGACLDAGAHGIAAISAIWNAPITRAAIQRFALPD